MACPIMGLTKIYISYLHTSKFYQNVKSSKFLNVKSLPSKNFPACKYYKEILFYLQVKAQYNPVCIWSKHKLGFCWFHSDSHKCNLCWHKMTLVIAKCCCQHLAPNRKIFMFAFSALHSMFLILQNSVHVISSSCWYTDASVCLWL